MALKALNVQELHAQSIRDLKLDAAALDLSSIEALSALLRRAALHQAPCPPRLLVDAVLGSLRGAIQDDEKLREQVEDLLEALISYGDLLELAEHDGAGPQRRLLFTAPPTFIPRESGDLILLGSFGELPETVTAGVHIESTGHIRRLPVSAKAKEVRESLLEQGFIELAPRAWLRFPPTESAPRHILRAKEALNRQQQCGELPGLVIIDPTSSVRYYRGRWVGPKSQTGYFVGRRPQAYGADLWCFIELKDGIPQKFLDLPQSTRARGCDEAWHLQLALDREGGQPQKYRVRDAQKGEKIIDVFSPIPAWAQRRLDVIGKPNPATNCLISYCIKESELQEEAKFLETDLWMQRE